ncbi:MAG: hypothetical protein GY698_18585 [Actinomycetia bacterium]|nr:hypothetical protein [Actinomycetes bacterium]
MDQPTCRYCGIEIKPSTPDRDLPEGVVKLAEGITHEACVYGSTEGAGVDSPGGEAARQYQQTRARSGISGA